MAELYGRTTGCSKGRGGSMHITSPDIRFPGSSAIVGGTIPLAVGVALSLSLKGEDNVSVTFFGDGAAGEGVFYESLNFAGLHKLPVIFVCENNFYSTHMPIAKCLSDIRIYKKAESFNIPGVQIDGNNVLTVYGTAKKAIKRARRGKGPTLLECLTYRWCGHVGPNLDIDKGLRTKEELDYWINRCPIKSLEALLLNQSILTEAEKINLSEEIDKEIEESISFAKSSPSPKPDELLKYVFKE